jgi:flavorubredoxin
MGPTATADSPVEIAPGTYWVGSSVREMLKRNIYLRTFGKDGKKVNLLIDPGPPVDFPVLSAKAAQIIGNLSAVNVAFVNHQDPDVTGNAPQLLALNKDVLFIMTEDTWRLVQYYGIPQSNFRAVERFPGFKTVFVSGNTLRFIPTPFCHFRGACMLYDEETRVLFSGDLLGGIAAMELMATGSNWAGIKAFHELYMPSNDALRRAVKQIRQLSPAPTIIAPQHGGIIEGELIERFLGKLEELPVGLDILGNLADQGPELIKAINEILNAAREMLGEAAVKRVLDRFKPDGSYPSIFALAKNHAVSEIKAEPFAAVESLAKMLFRECNSEQLRALQLKIVVIFTEHNLPPLESAIQ